MARRRSRGNFITRTWDQLPDLAKVGVLAVGGYGAYRVGRKIFPSKEEVRDNKTQVLIKSEIDTLYGQGIKATYPRSQYTAWADAMEAAMDGAGTDEDVIEDVAFKMMNDADVLELKSAFGVRKGENLTKWLVSDGALQLANAILASKAYITKRF